MTGVTRAGGVEFGHRDCAKALRVKAYNSALTRLILIWFPVNDGAAMLN